MDHLTLLLALLACTARHAAGRLSWNETSGLQSSQQIVAVTILGSAGNHTFLPNRIEAPIGALLRFNFQEAAQPLAALRQMHPCSSLNGSDNEYQPREISGELVAETVIETYDVQYMYFADVEFQLNCDHKNIFTLQPRRPYTSGTAAHARGTAAHAQGTAAYVSHDNCNSIGTVGLSGMHAAASRPTLAGTATIGTYGASPKPTKIYPPITNNAAVANIGWQLGCGIIGGHLVVWL